MKTFLNRYPVCSFLLLNFVWTWAFWFAALPFRGQTLLVLTLVVAGGFGPALAGILTLGAKNGFRVDRSRKRLLMFIIASGVIFGLFALRYWLGNAGGFEPMAEDMTLTAPILLLMGFASLVGGWVFSSAVSNNPAVRSRMGSMLPWRMPVGWTLLGILFYPLMILLSWGLAAILGLPFEYPALWGQSLLDVLPVYALTFAMTFLAEGGNEEPGWRGFLQPKLQKHFSPLLAAVIVSFFWSLWHLPLFLNGFYQADLVSGMLGGGIFRILLSIFLAWFTNRSGGNLFLTIFLHASFNNMASFLPASDVVLLVLWLAVVLVVVFRDKMWRKSPVVVEE